MPLTLDFTQITAAFAAVPDTPPPPPRVLLGRETPWPTLLAALHGEAWSDDQQAQLVREASEFYQRGEFTASAGAFLLTFLHPGEGDPYRTTERYRQLVRVVEPQKRLPQPSALSRLSQRKRAEWLREHDVPRLRRVFI